MTWNNKTRSVGHSNNMLRSNGRFVAVLHILPPGVKRNFWPLRNFWPVVAFQLFCFSE